MRISIVSLVIPLLSGCLHIGSGDPPNFVSWRGGLASSAQPNRAYLSRVRELGYWVAFANQTLAHYGKRAEIMQRRRARVGLSVVGIDRVYSPTPTPPLVYASVSVGTLPTSGSVRRG